jgi:hypothetical protein
MISTGVTLPTEALKDKAYRYILMHCFDVWQSTRDGMTVMDTLVEMLDYIQGFDTGTESFGNLLGCSHFDKGERDAQARS